MATTKPQPAGETLQFMQRMWDFVHALDVRSKRMMQSIGVTGPQRLVIRLGVHLLGETIPGRTMGFTGDGSATIKQEIGKKLRDRDREYSWDQAAEVAIADAMTTVFKQLAIPPKKQ